MRVDSAAHVIPVAPSATDAWRVAEPRPRLRPRTIGTVALAVLACEVLVLPHLVALDARVWRALLRVAGMDRVVDVVVTWTTLGGGVLLAVAAVVAARRDGLGAVWPPLAVCLLGLQLGKLLKNVFLRERPSMLPGIILGHSFPSGHVMNTTLAALAVVVLSAGFRHPARWRAAAGVMVGTVLLGRLLLAHHWLSDAIAGLLAALALSGLALPAVRHRPVVAPVLLGILFLVPLASVTHHRRLAIRLPSPLSAAGGNEVVIADALGTAALQGDWDPAPTRFRRGRSVWMRGHGAVTIETTRRATGAEAAARAEPLPGAQATLAFAGLPDMHERRSLTMHVTVNGRAIATFVPFFGWREYRLLVPADVLSPGQNEIRLDLTDDRGEPWRFALVYVRLAVG